MFKKTIKYFVSLFGIKSQRNLTIEYWLFKNNYELHDEDLESKTYFCNNFIMKVFKENPNGGIVFMCGYRVLFNISFTPKVLLLKKLIKNSLKNVET